MSQAGAFAVRSNLAGDGAGGIRPHLVDGTYELFRQHFGQKGRAHREPGPLDAVGGVLTSVLGMLGAGVTHIAVATDHVIESFRNALWAGYKDGSGVPPEITAQFLPLEEALGALGVRVFAMVELAADDALASAAHVAALAPGVAQVVICTPDKDLAQCVRGQRVVQLDRRTGTVFDEAGVIAKFGVAPESIPDWLALVGDSADGFPGLPGWGKRSAALVLAHYGHLDAIPAEARDWAAAVRNAVRSADKLATTLAVNFEAARLFLDLATLRVEEDLLADVEELRWQGPGPELAAWASRLGIPDLARRAAALAG